MSANEATVFIVDDDAAVRDSLVLLMKLRGFRAVGFDSAEAFLEHYAGDVPGCLVLDLRMPGMSGLELQRALADRGMRLPVIMVTAHGDVTVTRSALKAGAIDFLEKPVDDDVLVEAIRNALARDAEERSRSQEVEAAQARVERLTARERQVFELVVEGRHNREIAAVLGISPRTVEVYKARMMEKLRVSRLPDLVRLAERLAKTSGPPPT